MDVKQDSQTTPMLLAALGERSTERVKKLLLSYAILSTAARVGNAWRKKAKALTTYTVNVPGTDDLYPDLHEWVLERLPERRRRALTARFQSRPQDTDTVTSDAPSGSGEGPPMVRLMYDGRTTQTIDLDGHRIQVMVERESIALTSDEIEKTPAWLRARERIVFTAGSVAGRDAVLEVLDRLAAARQKVRRPRLQIARRWGGWQYMDLPDRPLDTVVLRAGQVERVIADLRQFQSREADYARLGLPWHRGILLHGPPRTGKSSFARAIACELGRDVVYIPLSALEGDSQLFELIGAISSRSLMLLEDIDIAHGAKVRDDAARGVTLSGLLNALDGMATPHGLISVMTTNDIDVLDSALLGPGRSDLVEEVGYLDDDQLARLVVAMFGEHVDLPPLPAGKPLSAASVVETLKANLGDPEAARLALKAVVADPPPIGGKSRKRKTHTGEKA